MSEPEKKLSDVFKDGLLHLYKCINWEKSSLDADAILFMNEVPAKVIRALKESEAL